MSKGAQRGNYKNKPRKKRSYSRKTNQLSQRKKFLLVCEGEKTEPIYFSELQSLLGKLNVNIQIEPVGSSISGVYKAAKKLSVQDDYDFVWIIGDKDEVSNKEFDSIIHNADADGFYVAYSNQKFELWFLLHFDYLTSSIDRRLYDSMLEAKIRKNCNLPSYHYTKACRGIGKILHDRLDTAISNSERLFELHGKGLPPSQRDPVTTVHELIKQFQKYKA